MNLQIAVACDSAAEYANRLCLLGTFDTIEAQIFPTVKTHCSFVFQIGWGKSEEGSHTVKVRFMNEDGQQMLDDIQANIGVAVAEGRFFTSTNHIINIQQLKFARPGSYLAAVSVDDDHLGEVQLQVIGVSIS